MEKEVEALEKKVEDLEEEAKDLEQKLKEAEAAVSLEQKEKQDLVFSLDYAG